MGMRLELDYMISAILFDPLNPGKGKRQVRPEPGTARA